MIQTICFLYSAILLAPMNAFYIIYVDIHQRPKLLSHRTSSACCYLNVTAGQARCHSVGSSKGSWCISLHLFHVYRMLQIKLDQPVSDPASPREISNGDTATNISTHIQTLRSEVTRLRNQLAISEQESKYNLESFSIWD